MDDLLARLLAALEAYKHIVCPMRDLRAELSAAVASGARLVMPEPARPVCFALSDRDEAYCGLREGQDITGDTRLVTCYNCKVKLGKSEPPTAERIEAERHADPEKLCSVATAGGFR